MTIKATGTLYSTVIYLADDADYNEFSGNKIIGGTTSSTATNHSVIYSYTGGNCSYCKFLNNEILNGSYGFYLFGGIPYTKGNRIENNSIKNFTANGVYIRYNDSILIKSNNIEITSNIGDNNGIYIHYTSSALIEKNRIHSTSSKPSYAIYINQSDGTVMQPGIIANNFISQSLGTNIFYGIYLKSSDYYNIYYNSANITAGNSSSSALCQKYGINHNLLNNNFANTGGGYVVYVLSVSSFYNSDYNNFYNTSNYLAYWGSNCTDLAALKTASSKDYHSLSVDPGFISLTNLHVNSAALNGAAYPIFSVLDDIDGDLRAYPNPDIGADEFVIAANDAGISSLISPAAACPGVNNVVVMLYNYGISTLTSAIINWKVNDTLMTPFNWTGSIANQASTPVTIGNYLFSPNISYNIKVWSSSPNNVTDLNNVNDTLLVTGITTTFSPGSYTIGSSTTADYPSFTAAINAIDSFGVCGPIVFNVETGIYNEQIVLHEVLGASAINTITFQSASGNNNDVILTYSLSTSSTNYVVRFDGGDYFKLKNLTIKAANSIYARVIEFLNFSNHNELIGNILEGQQLSFSTANFAIVYLYQTNANNNRFINNTVKYGSTGFYIYGASANYTSGIIIEGNDIIDFAEYGVYMIYCDSCVVRSNFIQHNPSITSYACGIYSNHCINGMRFEKNKIILTSVYDANGIFIAYCDGTSANPAFVANNCISAIGTSTQDFYGIYFRACTYTNFYYNSVNIEAGSNYSAALYYRVGVNVNVKNNIFSNTNGGYAIAYYNTPNVSTYFSDYNNIYTSGTRYIYLSGYKNTLALYQSASGLDSHSKSIVPGFTSSTDLHIFNLNLNGAATTVTGITDDYDGDIRNTVSPDIGADEVDIVTNDGGLSALVSPILACTGANNIVVKLKNYGFAYLTNITINWEVNDTLQTAFTWAGFLAQQSEDTVTIGSHIFNTGNSTKLKIWTSSPNGVVDIVNYNDTLLFENIKTALPSGTYTIGSDSSDDFSSFTSAINMIKSTGICGPIIINVDSGTYNEQIILKEIEGMSSTNTITFKSASGVNSDVILTYAASTTENNYVVKIDSGDYFKFQYITIKAIGTSYSNAIVLLNNATHNEFSNNLIISNSITHSNLNHCGIYSHTSSIKHNQFLNNDISNCVYGIWLYGATSNRLIGNQIDGNLIHNFSMDGIYCQYHDSVIIRYNIINLSENLHANSGIVVSSCNLGVRVEKNQINSTSNLTVNLIHINSCLGSTNDRGIIANNFLSQSIGISNTRGIFLSNSNYFDIYYNSVNFTLGNNNAASFYYSLSHNVNVRNNIFSNIGPGYAIVYGNNPTNFSFSSDYNNIYTSGSKFVLYGFDRSNLSQYISNSGLDSHSKSINSGFTSTTDLHLINVNLNGQGISVASVTDDFDGETRSTTIPDIGADEFIDFANDVAPISVSFPKNPCAAGNRNFKISIRNFGTSTLTSATINWKVDTILKTPFSWSGSINYLMMDSLINIGSHNLTIGNHTITIWTSLPNGVTDQRMINDTIVYQLSVQSAPSIAVIPNSLNITIPYCSDSVNVPLTIKNNGQLNLNLSMGISSDTVEILSLVHGYYAPGYNNILTSINTYFTKYNIDTTTTTNTSTLQSLLVGKDLVIIPFIQTTIGVAQIQAFSSILQTYVSNGGTVLFTGQQYHSQLTFGMGFFNGTSSGAVSNQTMTVINTNHPITNGLATTFFATKQFYKYNITNNDAVSLINSTVSGTPYDVLAYRKIGNGYAITSSYRFNQPISYLNREHFANIIEWSKTNSNPEWLEVPILQNVIQPSDSINIYLEFNSKGLAVGTHTGLLKIESNDINTPTFNLPCTLNVQNLLHNPVNLGNDTTVCGQITLNAGSYYSYLWSNLSIDTTLTVTSTGVYSVTVSNGQCTDTDTITVTVYSLPILSFSGLPNSMCTNNPTTTLYPWPLGGTFSGSGVNVNTFNPSLAGTGNHSITYTYTNSNNCTNTLTKSVTVSSYTPVSFSSIPSLYCSNNSPISLSGSPLGGTFIGAGVVNNTFNPSLAGAGTHTLVYSYTNTNGCSDQDSQIVTVLAAPIVTINGLSSTYCGNNPPDTISLSPLGGTLSGTGIFGNSFYPSVAGSGNHLITYNYLDINGCSDSATQIVAVISPPNVTFGGLLASYCENDSAVVLNGNPSGGSFIGNGISGNIFNPSSAMHGVNPIIYSYTDSITGCTSKNSMNTIVIKGFIANIGNDTAICFGSSIMLTTSGVPNYYWNTGDTVANITVNPLVDTSYIVTVTDTTLNCFSSDTVIVFVNNPLVNLGSDTNICSTESIILDAGAGYSYLWSDSSITQTISSDSTAYGIGTHPIWVEITDSIGCSSTDTIEITFVPNPIVNLGSDTTIKMTNGTITLDAGAGFSSYLWDDNSPNQIRQIVGSVVGLGIYTYYVDVIDSNGCMASDTIVIEVIDDTGISDKNNKTTVSIFPNPSKGMFKILINGIEGNLNLQIFDISGRIISSQKLNGVKNGYIKEIDASMLSMGIYYVKLTNKDIIILKKLVIQ